MKNRRLFKVIVSTCFILMLVALPFLVACSKPAPAPAPIPAPAPAPAPIPAPKPTPSPAPTPTPAETFTWIFATSPGSGANVWGHNVAPYRFQSMVEKATGGRLILETKVGLFPPREVIHGVIDGRAEIGFQRIPWVSGTFPLWDFGSLPFIFADNYEYEAALNDPRMIELTEKSYREVGLVKLLESPSTAQSGIFANQAFNTVEDFNGIKIRTSGLLQTYTMELFGSSPLTIAAAELAEALQRGTVDAIATSLGYGLGVGLADVTDHVSLWPVSSTFGGAIVVNAEIFDALPSDLQQILREVSLEVQGQIILGTDIDMRRAISGIKATGLTVVVPDKAEIAKALTLTKPVVDKWLEIAGPYGPELLAIISDYASVAK